MPLVEAKEEWEDEYDAEEAVDEVEAETAEEDEGTETVGIGMTTRVEVP